MTAGLRPGREPRERPPAAAFRHPRHHLFPLPPETLRLLLLLYVHLSRVEAQLRRIAARHHELL